MSDNLARAYNEILRDRYKTVRAISVPRNGDDGDMAYYALGILKSDRPGFMDFVFDELAPGLRKRGLEFKGITPYSMDETKHLFPDIWKEMQKDMEQDAARVKVRKGRNAAPVPAPLCR
jgi:hypothetical protein